MMPYITYNLIFLNVFISILGFTNPQLFDRWSFRPFLMKDGKEYHRFISSGFLHGSPMHLFFNMFTLWSFGGYIERLFGSWQFLLFYMICLVVSGLYSFKKYRTSPNYVAIGASGAVSGVILAFCMFQPFSMLSLFFFIPIPAFVFALLYIGFSFYASKNTVQGFENIGHEAHLAGALCGILLTPVFFPDLFAYWQLYLLGAR
jgi:membrane associated rhomboid family serine protease